MINWGYYKVIYKINDFLKNTQNEKHRNKIRIQLKNKLETISDKTEDFYLTYVW